MTQWEDQVTDAMRRLDDDVAAAVALPPVDAVIRRAGAHNRVAAAAAVAVATVGALGGITVVAQTVGSSPASAAVPKFAKRTPQPLAPFDVPNAIVTPETTAALPIAPPPVTTTRPAAATTAPPAPAPPPPPPPSPSPPPPPPPTTTRPPPPTTTTTTPPTTSTTTP